MTLGHAKFSTRQLLGAGLDSFKCFYQVSLFFRLGAERLMGSSEELQTIIFKDASLLLLDGSLDVR